LNPHSGGCVGLNLQQLLSHPLSGKIADRQTVRIWTQTLYGMHFMSRTRSTIII
jgi:hypothetical protein